MNLISIWFSLSTLLLTAMVSGGYSTSTTPRFDRAVFFTQPPRLLSVTSTFNNVNAPAIYRFTISLSQAAGNSLQRLELKQVSGSEAIQFSPQRVQISREENRRSERTLSAQLTVDQTKQTVLVTIDPPISPGTICTFALRPVRNPSADGIYLLAVTAFPAGEHAQGYFLGFGRFQLYQSGEE
jgi:hypothetical protein